MSAANPIAILGSGMAGCGAAHRLHQSGVRSVMYDKNAYYGGHTSSHQFPGGWTFDEGPHVSFTKEQRIQDLFAENVGGQFQTLATYVNNYWRGHWIKHPAQCNLYGLPTDLVVRVLRDFIAAQGRRDADGRELRGLAARELRRHVRRDVPDGVHRQVPHDDGGEPEHRAGSARGSTRPTLEEVLRGALEPSTADVHYISDFRYPTHGGFASYLAPFTRQTELRLGHEVVRIDPQARTLRFANGSDRPDYADLISSIPLPELVPMIEGAPADVRRRRGAARVHRGRDRVPRHRPAGPRRRPLDVLLRSRRLLHPAEHAAPAVTEHGSAGLRQPAGRVLLLAQVPAARPRARRLHRAGDPGPRSAAACCARRTRSCSGTRCTSPTRT